MIRRNMSVKQSAINFAMEYPLVAKVVEKFFYVDDGLTGADSVPEAIKVQKQLQNLFSGGFLLRKWNASDPIVLQHLPPDLKESQTMQLMPDPDQCTRTLGVQWNATNDHFHLNSC